ncbi:MAG: aminopeptidase [Saprospiraceae bacterium]
MDTILKKYADLLVNYCVEIKSGDKLYVRSSTLAEPLIREVYRSATRAGAHVEIDLDFREKNRIFLTEAQEHQLKRIPPMYKTAMETFDAYIYIRAPFNLKEDQNIPKGKSGIRSKAMKPVSKRYFERTATRELKRNLCQYPTLAAAQNADMSLEEYQQFIYGACNLFTENPQQAWLNRRKDQQKIVDLLNRKDKVQYKGEGIDITFSTKGRTWINSDGQTNMPSGEVYTSPVEDSVNGVVHFSFPAVYMGHEVEGVTLWVKDGYVEKWEAKRGQEFMDRILQTAGARRFGEAAIGTNYNINRFTKNILFDEKIGGTIHMALGQSYLQTGGKNQSAIHWDMIGNMVNGGQIFADDEMIYENGQFIF